MASLLLVVLLFFTTAALGQGDWQMKNPPWWMAGVTLPAATPMLPGATVLVPSGSSSSESSDGSDGSMPVLYHGGGFDQFVNSAGAAFYAPPAADFSVMQPTMVA